MKKFILLFTFVFTLSFTGCNGVNNPVVQQDGNLIITNYSSYEITHTTISHLGKTLSSSPKGIKDTQICRFTIAPADDYVYTVSFVDNKGEEHAQEFTDNFTKDEQILIAIRYEDSVWTIDYDK